MRHNQDQDYKSRRGLKIMTGRGNWPDDFASTRSTSRDTRGRNPVWGAYILRAIGLLAIAVSIWGAPTPARADCDVTDSGILTTGSDLLFTGGREGYFQALDARTGSLLWKTNLGAAINSGPISYRVGNRQYVSIVAGLALLVFAVDE